MDPEHTEDVLNHLEKQHELLTETHKTMTQELQKLEVEEEMMMRKFYELMSTHRSNKKQMKETQNVSQGKEIVEVEVSHTSSTSKELIMWNQMEETQNVSQGKEIVEVEAEVEASHKSSTPKELITYVRRRKKNQKLTQ